MKPCIVYQTEFGYTKECALFLKRQQKNSVVYSIDDNEDIPINECDTIWIGAPIYKGQIRKKTQNFIEKNRVILKKKKLGIFCSCLSQKDFNLAIQDSIPPDIFYHADIVNVGGRCKINDLNILQKRKLKKQLGITTDVHNEHMENLYEFIKKD